ncbi:MAG: hypothetical protein HFE51_02935 [Clostridia bacterium]|nr:hypothetical protein [Clostridia bacterium]
MNTKFTKVICAAAVITVTACAAVTTGFSGRAEAAKIDDSVSIQNVIINDASNSLWRSGNTMNCNGKTKVPSGYKAGLTMELQKYDGGWTTIKTWSSTGSTRTEMSRTHSVSSGYRYRLKTTHKAYNGAGGTAETIVKYSNEVSY